MKNSDHSSAFSGQGVLALLISLSITALAAAIGAAASIDAPDFYETLAKPTWAPSARVFGPVWTALYLLMAMAAWMVWLAKGHDAKGPLTLYLAQLALNALWTWLFFQWRSGAWALIEIIVLWVILIPTIIGFLRVRKLAGVLLLPYWGWVSFAAALTAAIWRLNPGML